MWMTPSRGRSAATRGAALAVLLGVMGLAGCSGGSSAPREVAPAAVAVSAPAGRDAAPALAGTQSCRKCHERFYTLWSTSHHGTAMQAVTADFVREKLTPPTADVTVRGVSYRAVLDDGKAPYVRARGPGGEGRHPIVHAMGGKNVYYFLTPLERGRLQVLPVAYDVHKRAWYDTAASGMRHFEGVREQEVHWTDREFTFNTSCHGCHVSQMATNFDLASDTYRTTWAEPGINCETCHGPASRHVALMDARNPGDALPEDVGLVKLGAGATVAQNNAACASCHAKATFLTAAFAPGESFFDHFGLVTLEHPDYYPDGRDLGENYTQTSWLMSACAKGGELSCLHCHTSSGRNRFAAPGAANQACLPCHKPLVDDPTAHSRHAAGTKGNECVSCHMPTTRFAAMSRSDHSMRPPAPAASLRFKSPNACNLCHAEKDAAWADEWARKWYGPDYQEPILAQGDLIDAGRRQDWSKLDGILDYLRGPGRDPVVAASLANLLDPSDDERKWPVLEGLLDDPSPLVRAAAIDRFDGRADPPALDRLVKAAADPARLVRIRAAEGLAGVPRAELPPEGLAAVEAATAELEASLRSRPDDAHAHATLADLHMRRGQVPQAIAEYDLSLKMFPQNVPALVNASLAYNAAGRNDRAEDALRRAIGIAPEAAAAHFNLGLLLAELGRASEAESALRLALKHDARLAAAAYNLAVLVAPTDPDEAVALARQAVALRPRDARYAFTLAYQLSQRPAGADEATAILRDLVARQPGDADAHLLLADLHAKAGRAAEARAVLQAAARQSAIPERERLQIRRRLDAPPGPR
jgi:tetratricopeptide (TPR) repeat protein